MINLKRYRGLIAAAKKIQKMSYCPYSRYPVGAAVLTERGHIYTGVNVENASYGLSICAERAAIFNAVGRGEKSLRAICVVSRSGRPCGACRQVMLEFSTQETLLLTVNLHNASQRETITCNRVFGMLPHPFDPLAAGLLSNPQNLLKYLPTRRARKSRRGQ